jgi:hypothetical protein
VRHRTQIGEADSRRCRSLCSARPLMRSTLSTLSLRRKKARTRFLCRASLVILCIHGVGCIIRSMGPTVLSSLCVPLRQQSFCWLFVAFHVADTSGADVRGAPLPAQDIAIAGRYCQPKIPLRMKARCNALCACSSISP